MTRPNSVVLQNTLRNFNRTRERIADMVEEWRRVGGCCPGCMYGEALRILEQKQRNRYQLLKGKGFDVLDPDLYP